MEQLKNFNYMYVVYAVIGLSVIFLLYTLYVSFSKSKCLTCVGPNALPENIKKAEGFSSDEEIKAKQESKMIEDEAKIKGEIILFYAMWCGHSRSFLPEWEKFEKFAKDNLPYVRVTKIRCEDGNEATCSQKGVQGFPMVILYPKSGAEKTFEKDRTMEKLVEFVNENL